MVNDPGEQFLSRSGLAEEKDAAPRIGNLADLIYQPLERRALADNAAEVIDFSNFTLEQDILGLEVLLPDRIPHHLLDFFMDDRFHDVIVGPRPQGLDGRLEGGIGGHDDENLLRRLLVHPAEHLDPVDSREDNIGDDYVVHIRFEQNKPLFRRLGGIHGKPFLGEYPFYGLPQGLLIFNNQHALRHSHSSRGMEIIKRVPFLSESTSIEPPWSLIIL